MKEELLHYVWKTKRFNVEQLATTKGAPVNIVDFGIQNHDAGPDFTQCKIKIGRTTWIGNVEMHTKSSQWYVHQHEKDRNYGNVVLHVVYEDDRPVRMANGEELSTIVLNGRIDKNVLKNHQLLEDKQSWIPCEKMIHTVPEFKKNLWLDRLMIERLQRKTNYVQSLLKATNNDWDESFFQALCRNLGLKVNSFPFEALGKSILLKTILKYKGNNLQIEAILFGQAGMLEQEFEEDYPKKLKREYKVLQHKHKLKPIDGSLWKFMRLRPANFPTIRLAQLAQLLYQSNHLFSKILAVINIKEVENMFDVKLVNYWKNHYQFDKQGLDRPKNLGKSTIHLLIINTVVPFLFHYGKLRKDERYVEKSLDLLRSCPPERNSIIKKWKALDFAVTSAHSSQALIQLKNEYCSNHKCLNCSIGHSIIKGS